MRGGAKTASIGKIFHGEEAGEIAMTHPQKGVCLRQLKKTERRKKKKN